MNALAMLLRRPRWLFDRWAGRDAGAIQASPGVKRLALVIVDISGYTGFVRSQRKTLLHAQEIIAQLIEAVIDKATHPLVLNKLEGDAAFLYAELGDREAEGARDVARQVKKFFACFNAKAQELSASRSSCPCEACQRIRGLKLKAVLHSGVAGFRSIRQFEELTGEDVILVHRLLKNTIPAKEYVLMTEEFHRLAGDVPQSRAQNHEERYEDLGSFRVKVFFPELEGFGGR